MPQRRGDPVDVGRIADVAGVHGGPGAEPRGQSGDILARNGSPADQGEVPGPKGDQLLRRGQPERPQPAGDQVGPVRPDLHRRGGALLGEPDHELADVRAAAERRERLVELLRGVPGGRDRPQLAGREQIHHRPQDPRDDLAQFRLGPVAEVEAAVRHIGPYRRHLVGRPDPGPAELDEPAAAGERTQAGLDVAAVQAVEDHIDPTAAGGPQHLLGEVEGARVVHVLHALLAQERPLVRAGGGVHLGAGQSGELHRGLTDPARRGVDQHRLARPETGEFVQGVVGVDVRRGLPGGGHKAEAGGLRTASADGTVTCRVRQPRWLTITSSPGRNCACGPAAVTVPAHS